MCRIIINEKNHIKIYFVGIGGISMSSLALYLKNKGLKVSGYDDNVTQITKSLIRKKIKINRECDLINCDVAVVSSAISSDHKIIKKLEKLNKKIISRSELLKRISDNFKIKIGVSGTHGKTTCTCMIAHILKEANKKFTAHIGGLDKDFGNLANFGNEIFLSEICEYKKNIANYSPDYGIILNVDDDHIESYGNFENLKEEFKSFAKRSKVAIINYDDKNLCDIKGVKFSASNKINGYFASDVKMSGNTIEYVVNRPIGPHFKVKIHSFYNHDVTNSLCAVALCDKLNIDSDTIKKGLLSFKGVKRRSEVLGFVGSTLFYADYAHHPSEVKNVVNMLKDNHGKVAILFQSHTYSRTKRLMKEFSLCFKNFKNIFIFDTYGAREKFDEGGSGKTLSKNIENSLYCGGVENTQELLKNIYPSFDTIAVIGAGNLYDEVFSFVEKYNNKNI